MNKANVYNTGKYADAGGNIEIIHLCEQKHLSFKDAYETAIEFHRNEIFKYLYENKIIKTLDIKDLEMKCISHDSYKLLKFLMKKEDSKFIESNVYESARIGNLFLVKYFIDDYFIPINILIPFVCSENIEICKMILEKENGVLMQKMFVCIV